jgi:hypothetical protein
MLLAFIDQSLHSQRHKILINEDMRAHIQKLFLTNCRETLAAILDTMGSGCSKMQAKSVADWSSTDLNDYAQQYLNSEESKERILSWITENGMYS